MSRPVVLVSLDWIRPGDPRMSLGTASIAAALRAEHVDVRVVADAVNRPGFDADAFAARTVVEARAAGPRALVGVGAFVWNEPEITELIPRLKRQTDATVVVGGPQVSFGASGTLERCYPDADLFVRGHGEAAMVDLALERVPEQIRGLHRPGTVDAGARAEVPLEHLPSPHLDGTLPPGRFVRWETQRGCPFTCSFCQHREAGRRLRRREFARDRLDLELAAFAARGTLRIAVLDPIFHAKPARAVELLHRARHIGLRATLSLQCRFELVDEAFLDALEGLDVELEFGLQTIHPDEGKAIHRPNRVDVASRVIDALHARRIPFEVSLIYGLPLQTLDRFRESVRWCLDHRVPRVRAWPLMLLRGTPLEAERARWGLVEQMHGRIPVVVASDTFTREDHAEMGRIAQRLLDGTRPVTGIGSAA